MRCSRVTSDASRIRGGGRSRRVDSPFTRQSGSVMSKRKWVGDHERRHSSIGRVFQFKSNERNEPQIPNRGSLSRTVCLTGTRGDEIEWMDTLAGPYTHVSHRRKYGFRRKRTDPTTPRAPHSARPSSGPPSRPRRCSPCVPPARCRRCARPAPSRGRRPPPRRRAGSSRRPRPRTR